MKRVNGSDVDILKLILGVGTVLVTIGIAWGSLNGRIDRHDKEIGDVEDHVTAIHNQQITDGKDMAKMSANIDHIYTAVDEIKNLLLSK